MEIFKIENLSFLYPEQKEKTLKYISFSVNEGEFFTICGLSGSGKSTLLRHLKTSLTPYGTTCGDIYYRGKPLAETDELTQAKEIGFVMQSPENQNVTDKVWHELAFGLENLGISASIICRKVAETALYFGLQNKMYSKISELSGGQKQILNLAAVMIQEPSVLILDEPTAQLDPVAAESFVTLLKKIHIELGTTVILCEHTLENICTLTDRIMILDNGCSIFEGDPENTAIFLSDTNNPLIESMPVSARITSEKSLRCDSVCMTIGEGKKFLIDYIRGINLQTIEHRYFIPPEKQEPIVDLKNIFFRYNKNSSDILKGITISAWGGEILAIVGSNGSGKTTFLNTIAGVLCPYSGRLFLDPKCDQLRISLLPQDPKTVFLKDSVEEDLYSIFDSEDKEYYHDVVEKMLVFCGLEKKKSCHPYDLSGGEQQIAALAKVLLKRPDVLLLDEPVNSMDVRAKAKMGAILKSLAESGICVIMVSHDLEFCAEYSDRCAFLFDGELISCAAPEVFFSENRFFTTAAAQMAKDVIPNAVSANDIRKALSIPLPNNKKEEVSVSDLFRKKEIKTNSSHRKKQTEIKRICIGIGMALLIPFIYFLEQIFEPQIAGNNSLLYITVFVLFAGLIILNSIEKSDVTICPVNRSAKSKIAETALVFLFIPFTVFIGVSFLGDEKYLFISLLILLECTVPFFAIFENRHVKTRELVLISVMCAMAVTVRTVFYMFPQFKPITAVIIISGAALGAESGFLIGSVSMLTSNILFGQGPWTPWQMFSMGLIGFISGIIFNNGVGSKNKYTFSVFGLLVTPIVYGGIMNPAALILSHSEITYKNLLVFYAAGFPLDLVHGISTAVFLYFGAVPIIKKIERVKQKYGLICSYGKEKNYSYGTDHKL